MKTFLLWTVRVIAGLLAFVVWSPDVELADEPVTRSWQLAGIAPLGDLDQLTLLRSSSVSELLERTAQLTTEALDLLPLQFPDDPG